MCRTAWLGVHPGTAGYVPRYTVHERALYFKSTYFLNLFQLCFFSYFIVSHLPERMKNQFTVDCVILSWQITLKECSVPSGTPPRTSTPAPCGAGIDPGRTAFRPFIPLLMKLAISRRVFHFAYFEGVFRLSVGVLNRLIDVGLAFPFFAFYHRFKPITTDHLRSPSTKVSVPAY